MDMLTAERECNTVASDLSGPQYVDPIMTRLDFHRVRGAKGCERRSLEKDTKCRHGCTEFNVYARAFEFHAECSLL